MDSYIFENTLYSTDAERQDLVNDQKKLAEAFVFNFLAMLGAYNGGNPTTKAKLLNYFKRDKKLRVANIGDENNDMSLVIRLMKEADVFKDEAVIKQITRFLVLLKTGKIEQVDSKIIAGWLDKIKPMFLLQIKNKKLRQAVMDLKDDGGQNIDVSRIAVLAKKAKHSAQHIGDFFIVTKSTRFKDISGAGNDSTAQSNGTSNTSDDYDSFDSKTKEAIGVALRLRDWVDAFLKFDHDNNVFVKNTFESIQKDATKLVLGGRDQTERSETAIEYVTKHHLSAVDDFHRDMVLALYKKIRELTDFSRVAQAFFETSELQKHSKDVRYKKGVLYAQFLKVINGNGDVEEAPEIVEGEWLFWPKIISAITKNDINDEFLELVLKKTLTYIEERGLDGLYMLQNLVSLLEATDNYGPLLMPAFNKDMSDSITRMFEARGNVVSKTRLFSRLYPALYAKAEPKSGITKDFVFEAIKKMVADVYEMTSGGKDISKKNLREYWEDIFRDFNIGTDASDLPGNDGIKGDLIADRATTKAFFDCADQVAEWSEKFLEFDTKNDEFLVRTFPSIVLQVSMLNESVSSTTVLDHLIMRHQNEKIGSSANEDLLLVVEEVLRYLFRGKSNLVFLFMRLTRIKFSNSLIELMVRNYGADYLGNLDESGKLEVLPDFFAKGNTNMFKVEIEELLRNKEYSQKLIKIVSKIAKILISEPSLLKEIMVSGGGHYMINILNNDSFLEMFVYDPEANRVLSDLMGAIVSIDENSNFMIYNVFKNIYLGVLEPFKKLPHDYVFDFLDNYFGKFLTEGFPEKMTHEERESFYRIFVDAKKITIRELLTEKFTNHDIQEHSYGSGFVTNIFRVFGSQNMKEEFGSISNAIDFLKERVDRSYEEKTGSPIISDGLMDYFPRGVQKLFDVSEEENDTADIIVKAIEMAKTNNNIYRGFKQKITRSEIDTTPMEFLMHVIPNMSKENVEKILESDIRTSLGIFILDFKSIKDRELKNDYIAMLSRMLVSVMGKNARLEKYLNDIIESDPNIARRSRQIILGAYVVMDEYQESLSKLNIEPGEVKVNSKTLDKLLRYNDIDLSEIVGKQAPRKKKGEPTVEYFKRALQELKSMDMSDVLDDFKVEEVADADLVKTTRELMKHHKGQHGDIYPIVRSVFKANIVHPEYTKFKEKRPDTKVMKGFHGSGNIATSMILRYGYTVIKSSDSLVVGRMLGNGIYFTNVIDKAMQYVSDSGYVREIGTKGFVFEIEAQLGNRPDDFDMAGTGESPDIWGVGLVSPEWCVRDPKAQIKIEKVYRVEVASEDKMRNFLKEVYTMMGFREYITEQLKNNKHVNTFIFRDGMIPYFDKNGDVQYADFEIVLKKKLIDPKLILPSKQGPMVVMFGGKRDTETDCRFGVELRGKRRELYRKLLQGEE